MQVFEGGDPRGWRWWLVFIIRFFLFASMYFPVENRRKQIFGKYYFHAFYFSVTL